MKSVNCDLKRLCECSRHYQYFVWQVCAEFSRSHQATVFFNQLKKDRSELKFDVDNLKLCYKHGF